MLLIDYIRRLLQDNTNQTELESFLRTEYRRDYENLKRMNVRPTYDIARNIFCRRHRTCG